MSKVVDWDQNEEIGEDESVVDVLDNDPTNSAEELEQEHEENLEAEAGQEEEPEIPEKFRGKSTQEILDMYMNLEKELGRKGNEVGELRKLTDQFLELKIQEEKNNKQGKETRNEPEVSDDDWFTSPKTATEKYLESSPTAQKVNDLEAKLREQELAKAHTEFEERHPDWKQLGGEDTFRDFITSSEYRYNLAQNADSGDYSAANELFDLYKMYRQANGVDEGAKKQANREQLDKDRKKASVESTSSAPTSKKVYRRADLMKLRMNDPDKYEAMQSEIMAAYAEGRVR